MNESEEKEYKNSRKEEYRCDSTQLALLLECSKSKDITEWNKWREKNHKEEIWLEGADLQRAHLAGANLEGAHLEGANFNRTYLQRANLSGANLEGVDFTAADMNMALLWCAHLERASLQLTNLQGACLLNAHLEEAEILNAHLEGADFKTSFIDGLGLWYCYVDRLTDFRGVGLDNCRIDEGTKYILKYNRRRMNWEDWYIGESEKKWVGKTRLLLTCPVRLFWCLSDYGRSTIRILTVFLALSIVFAVAYWAKPDFVIVNGQVGGLTNFLHALYFSVVTMTTLGFGDIAANPQSSCGQVLLMLQVFCGYFLLGAIVTRLSILFTAGGPAGRFSKRRKK